MFERQVTDLLTQLLGNYVEPSCFRHDKVNVGVWSGYVVLQHLELQRKIYPSLGVAVVRGVLGQITIKIPWNRLVYDSVLVTIDDVYILLRNVNREDLVPPPAEMEQILKKKLIEELYQAKLETDQPAVDDSFLRRLRTKILDNLEFHIRRIHIRFQDATSGDHPFTFGLTMESLHAQSTDANWQPTYVDSSTSKEPMIYKSFELNHLGLYLNPDCSLHGHDVFDGTSCSLEQFTDAFSRSIPKRIDLTMPPPTPQSGETKHHFILKPVNASAHLKIKRDYNDNQPPHVPNMELQVLIDEVALQLEESQYCDLLFLRTALKTPTQAKSFEKYHRFRPQASVFQAPRAWWQYAIRCIKSNVEEKHTGWSWLYMKERRDDKVQYVDLWQTLQLASMPEHFLGDEQTQKLQAELEAIEMRRSVEDVLLFRFLADMELKKLHPTASDVAAAGGAPVPASSSYYSFWNLLPWSGVDYSTKAEGGSGQELERQELYRILGYDPTEQPSEAAASREFSVFSIQLNQGSITLLNDPDTKYLRTSSQYSRSYAPQPFFTALFSQVHTDIVQLAGDNTKMELSLQTMELFDESMDDGRCILKRRVPMSSLNVEITMLTPVFRLSYENAHDQMLKLFMEPLEIVYSPTALCWVHLSTFSTAPEALGLWAEMEMQALNEFVNFKARTEAKVEYAMANRIPIAVDVRIQAPVIILPASDDELLQSPRLILDLGHVHFRTERLSNLNVDVTSSVQAASTAPPMSATTTHHRASVFMANSTNFAKQLTDEAETGEGATRWKEEFYDKFACTMSNLHVMLLPPSVPYSPELLMHSTTPFSLVDPFHINVTMRKSVLPLDATLYQLYVHADLPALSLHVSMGQYHHLSKVLGRFKMKTPPSSSMIHGRRTSTRFPFPPMPPSILQQPGTTAAYQDDETQSVMSDDTWFSVECDDQHDELAANMASLDDDQDDDAPPTPPSPARRPPRALPSPRIKPPEDAKPTATAFTHVPSFAPTRTPAPRKILDRRVVVCTVTIPIIQVHFQKADDDSAGRVTCSIEGIKVRLAKRTLSTTMRLRLASVAVDDHAENMPTHHLLFSCTTQPAMPYTSLLPKTARRGSLHRRKVSLLLPSVAGDPTVDLLDINFTSDAHDATQLEVTFGHLHVQFDQARLAAMLTHVLALFDDMQPPTAAAADPILDAIPPLSLLDSSLDDLMPLRLPESIRLDLEKARHSLLHQAKTTDESRGTTAYRVKLHVHSLSVCFSNHMDLMMSMALLHARLEGTLDHASSMQLGGSVGNLHVIDLVSSDLLHLKRKDRRYHFQEVFGLAERDTAVTSPVLSLAIRRDNDQGHLKLTVQQVRCVLSTRFLLKMLHYGCEGPLMEALDRCHRRHHIHAAPHSPPARDIFFSPALTFDDMHRSKHRGLLEPPPPPPVVTSPTRWTMELEMHAPYVVLPLHKNPNHASLEVNHGAVLELGHILVTWTQAKTTLEMKHAGLRSLHDDFEFIRPLHVDVEMVQGRVRVHLLPVHFQLSEVHAAMLVELYFQGYLPLVLYNQPSSKAIAVSAPARPLHVNVSCDAVGFSLFTAHPDIDAVVAADDDETGLGGTIFDMFMLLPHDTTLVASLQFTGLSLAFKREHTQTSADLVVAQVTLQDTVVSPSCTFQYRHAADKHVHSCWIDSKACRLVVDPPFVVRVATVGMETLTNVEHTLQRHQNQPVSEYASSVYDDAASEYQWTERGRSNSIASSIHLTAPPPPPPHAAVWNYDIGCKLVQIEYGDLMLAGHVACKKDQSQLLVRLQHVRLYNTAHATTTTLLHPVEVVLRHQPHFPVDTTIEHTLRPHHDHVPETLRFTSLQCSPVSVTIHLQDIPVVLDSVASLSSLAKTLDNVHAQLRPTEVFPHAASTGEEAGTMDGLQYVRADDVDDETPKSPSWRHVCVDVPTVQLSVVGHAASVLSLSIEPSEFEWIATPLVLSLTWKWHVQATYMNNRLLEMEPLVEPMTIHFKLWQSTLPSTTTTTTTPVPLQVELKSVDEVKVNCTFALLETLRLLSRMTLEKELASCVVKNETGVTFQVGTPAGPIDMTPGTEMPLQPATTIRLLFADYNKLQVPTSEVGTRTYRLSSSTLGAPVDCVVAISVQRGCKLIVVQSTWLIENKTATPLHVQLVFPTGGITPRPPYHCLLAPLEALAVPMSLVSFRGTQIYVKPDGVATWTLVEHTVVDCGPTTSFVLYAMWDDTNNRRVLSFCAPLVLHNAMPTELEYRLTRAPGHFESGKLGVGEKCVYHGSEHDTLTLEVRTKGFAWSQSTDLVPGTISMIDHVNHSVLVVHIDVDTAKSSQWEVSVYVPYWVLNQTGLELEYQHEMAFLGPEHINPFAAGQARPRTDESDADKFPVPPVAVKRKHQLLPSIPPNRGLLDLIPKKVSIAAADSPLLAVCHTHLRHGVLKLQLRLKGKGSSWSNVLSCHISGANGECTIRDNGRVYVVGFVLEHGTGWYERTQVLTLVPRFLLINALDEHALDVLLDETTSTSVSLERNAQLPWHFTAAKHHHTIRIRFAAPGWVWSGALSLHTTGDQTLRLRNTMDRTAYLIRISIKLEGPQYRIVFRSSTNVPPYRIENFSLETIRIHQSRVRISDILLPHQTCEYTWDEPLKPHLLVVDMLPSQADDNSRPIRIGIFSMDEIVEFGTKTLAVEVRADGPTRVLRLTDFTPFAKPLATTTTAVSKKDHAGWSQYLVAPVVDVHVKLHSVSVSLVDSTPSELLYISWNTVGFHAAWTKQMAHLALHVSVHSMQIDNQVRTTRYPVLLNFTASPALEATIVRETAYTSIEFLRYVNVVLQPMRWRIDGTLINDVATMFVSHVDIEQTTAPTREDRLRDFDASTQGLLTLPPEKHQSKKLYFEKFELAPIQATLSFATSSASPSTHVQVASVRQILQAAGKTLTKIHNAPLHWRALRWQHVFVPRETMLNQMRLHYQHEAYRQAYLLLGSVDVLGNPVKVWQNLRGGVASFLWEPMRGWQESPQAFGFGLVKGTTLLLRAFIYAILDFNTRIASSVLLGLSDACQRIDTYTGYPVAKTFYQDIAQGASGIVVSPMYSYDLQGWSGLLPGVLAGLLGLVLKPLRGFTHAFVTTTTTLRDGIQYDTQAYVVRMRPPRYIDPRTHLLTSYSYVHASGEDIKYNITQARYEDYVGHVMSAERNQCLLVTKHRVLSLQVHTHPHHSVSYTVMWEILSDDLIVVAFASPDVLVLYHKPDDIGDLVVPTQEIELPPNQALSVYYMLQQMTSTAINQASTSTLNVRFVDKCNR
ncbi:Aste57867_17461 [Aphanomyces stellatus]|uniref:Aste57867_17461 protein n=1 Tax=Aphanomyces stellatus TaxID=120398 RepID=A0A485L8L0_9STRA|nr:hypothetical protein As57867_017401 [Aphanomyces stellatus]VFT94215.1 Aste57867_17461 [Aphanomyces stellatus]